MGDRVVLSDIPSLLADTDALRGQLLAGRRAERERLVKDIETARADAEAAERAADRAEQCHAAEHADFFSFGTNDLTQTGLGFSRVDIEGSIVSPHIDLGILDRSPFETIDGPADRSAAVRAARSGPASVLTRARSRRAPAAAAHGRCAPARAAAS